MPIYANELDDIYRQMEMARISAQAAQSASPQLGSNVSALLRDFPWLPPGTAYALAGQGVTGAAAAPIANLDLQSQVEKNPTKFQRNRLRAKRKEPEVHRGLFGSGFGPDFGVDLTPGKPLNPDAYKKWRNDKLGFDPEKPVKPVVRTAAVVANTAYQGVIGLGRSAMSEMPSGTFLNPEFHDPKFIQPGDPIGSVVGLGKSVAAQTEGGQAVASLARGEPVDFGSGYLPSPDSPQAKRAAAAARYYSPQLYAGHAWTPGRQLADFLFEPDTTPYTILSGLTDAAVVRSPADPTATALGVVGEAGHASKAF